MEEDARWVLITRKHKQALWDAMHGGDLTPEQLGNLLMRCHDICDAYDNAPTRDPEPAPA